MDGLAAAAFCFGLVGVVALVRLEKLIKTLKEKGVLEQDYKEELVTKVNKKGKKLKWHEQLFLNRAPCGVFVRHYYHTPF